MQRYVIAPPATVAIPVAGGGLFPVRRVFCVGRNYAAHTREMGGDPGREPPFFFMRPADALLSGDADMPYPPATAELHHEVELVVALGSGGADISEQTALQNVWGYAVGLDMTRRDLQRAAKREGKPWDMSKGFDCSAPIGALLPATRISHPTRGRITLRVNGALRQDADLARMIWSLPEMIARLSREVRLARGDLIFTGTPAGIAPVQRGDQLEGEVEGVGSVRTRIA
ncbi:MAG: fumarylacetoacetate hydrolase family protein [Acetobacteraceae bacterium]